MNCFSTSTHVLKDVANCPSGKIPHGTLITTLHSTQKLDNKLTLLPKHPQHSIRHQKSAGDVDGGDEDGDGAEDDG